MRELRLEISGKLLQLEHLVLDYNGTLAFHGRLLQGVAERLRVLADKIQIHVLTADSFGTVESELQNYLPHPIKNGHIRLALLPQNSGDEAEAKLHFLQNLGAEQSCAMGNGVNDQLMLNEAALSVCVMGREGCSPSSLLNSDIVVHDICDALDLLIVPGACIATLRR